MAAFLCMTAGLPRTFCDKVRVTKEVQLRTEFKAASGLVVDLEDEASRLQALNVKVLRPGTS